MQREDVILDYGDAATPKLLGNLSAVAAAGPRLWTASDELRTIERLAPFEDGYRLEAQVRLDRLFPGLPPGEADIESMDFDGRRLWISGSHCRVRLKPEQGHFRPGLRTRDSRRLFGSVEVEAGGGPKPRGQAAPFKGRASLRRVLEGQPFLAPFLELPSKEGGLDIEGLVILGSRALLGLRGPTIESCAVIVEVEVRGGISLAKPALRFVSLGGLGVRDLMRAGEDILILAGPTNALHGPFAIFRWRPRASDTAQAAALVHDLGSTAEHPEGLCALSRGGRQGVLLLHDTPDPARIEGSRYRADWLALS